MTKLTEFTFLSTDGKTRLHAMEWRPEGDVRAVVQILHGVSEHISRYDRFARFLCDHGFAVVGHDHLGHGDSVGEGDTPIYFGKGNTWNTVVDDAYALHCRIKESFPGTKLVLMGHSMGSFLCRTFLRFGTAFPGTFSGFGGCGGFSRGVLLRAAGSTGCRNQHREEKRRISSVFYHHAMPSLSCFVFSGKIRMGLRPLHTVYTKTGKKSA